MNNTNESAKQGLALLETPVQKQRYYSIYSIYGEEGAKIVLAANGRGPNSWRHFLEKMELITKCSRSEREYLDALYDTFDVGIRYTLTDIIVQIADVRRELDLAPYTYKIQTLSLRDFLKAFITKDWYEELEDGVGDTKLVVKGYVPIFKIKP